MVRGPDESLQAFAHGVKIAGEAKIGQFDNCFVSMALVERFVAENIRWFYISMNYVLLV